MTFFETIWMYIEPQLGWVIRLCMACVCGGLVGYERSRRRKEAGIRTHILVALGSALAMIISKYSFFDILIHEDISLDPSRLASNVITGISFLGAGVIFVRGVSIRGLTTAAGVWTTAGIGLAVGAGLYVVAFVATALILVIQIVLYEYLRKWDGPIYETISLRYVNAANGLERLKYELASRNIVIHNMKMKKNEDDTISVILEVSRENAITCVDLADILAHDPQVKEFSL
mgnify:CR=1 FL=1